MTYAASLRSTLLAFCLAALAGCSAISAISGATTALEVLELRVPGDLPVAPGRPLPRDVVIELPTSGGAAGDRPHHGPPHARCRRNTLPTCAGASRPR